MSADNCIYIKRFGKNDFRYTEIFLSSVPENSDEYLLSLPETQFGESFPTPLLAKIHAIKNLYTIEYGFVFSDDCLVIE